MVRRAPAGSGNSGDHQDDIRGLGELLAWSLTGADPALDPDRLSRAAGYHPIAVQLWQDVREGCLSTAATFRDGLQRLARQLGLP
jgi:hypothetical protein